MNLAAYYGQYGPMMDHGDGSWLGALFGLVFLLIIVGVVVYAIRAFSGGNHFGQPTQRDPLDIARERYAKGEITREELAEIKAELK